jgi:hypothetical protein
VRKATRSARGLAAGVALCCATAWAELAPAPAEDGISVSAGLVHRRLDEVGRDGRRLVRESGPLLRLQGGVQLPVGATGGALRAEAAAAAGTLDYRGQTQAGAPLDTHSAHRDLELAFAWRPVGPAPWGEGWLVLRTVQQRRQIASTPVARGLRETSNLVLPGVRWSHTLQAGGWEWHPAIELRASARHRLEVDFGGLFDAADLEGGRRRELALALDAARAGSPWSFGLAWTRTRQSASPVQALTRAGSVVGSVNQPRIEIDDVLLRATRAF